MPLNIIDPLAFKDEFWPGSHGKVVTYRNWKGQEFPCVDFYEKQIEVVYSVEDDLETYVPAGNKLGCWPRHLDAMVAGRKARITSAGSSDCACSCGASRPGRLAG